MIRSTGSLFKVSDLGPDDSPVIDVLSLEWFETSKTILRKRTKGGLDVAIRKDSASNPLYDGDIIYTDGRLAVVVEIQPCECLVVTPAGFREMTAVCHEIGNRHIPVYIAGDAEIVTEFEYPLYHVLAKKGYAPGREMRVLYHTHTLSMTGQKSPAPKVTFK